MEKLDFLFEFHLIINKFLPAKLVIYVLHIKGLKNVKNVKKVKKY